MRKLALWRLMSNELTHHFSESPFQVRRMVWDLYVSLNSAPQFRDIGKQAQVLQDSRLKG